MKPIDMVRLLVKRRHQLGLTQEEVARRIGWNSSNLATKERIAHFPSVTTLVKWAEAMNLEITLTDKAGNRYEE